MAVVYGSSLRDRPAAETLARIAPLLRAAGITRVTETTRLDRLGVPVAVGVRPSAHPKSLCVSAGKGMTLEEARVGAAMEALEFHWVEPGRAALAIRRACIRDLLDGAVRPRAVLDLCPVWGITLDLDAPVDCVDAVDVRTGAPALVPAELVLHPYAGHFFGSGTNGLASGNSVEEATVHALCEVFERDVLSFHRVASNAPPVSLAGLPRPLAGLVAGIAGAGFTLVLRALPNPFGLGVFHAVIFDPGDPLTTLPGSGCHLDASIAATRAITEAAQARLTLIHGARDDLPLLAQSRAGRTPEDVERLLVRVMGGALRLPPIELARVPSSPVHDVGAARDALLEILARAGFRSVLRVVLTPPDYPVAVVRVIVPGLECYSQETRRRGPRLAAFLRGVPADAPGLW